LRGQGAGGHVDPVEDQMSSSTTWAPGWFPDPTGRHDHRWWDGVEWTAHVADAGTAGKDPLGSPPAPTTTARAGSRTGSRGAEGRRTTAVEGAWPRGPRPTTALILSLAALLGALVPFFGLFLAVIAAAVALAARRSHLLRARPGRSNWEGHGGTTATATASGVPRDTRLTGALVLAGAAVGLALLTSVNAALLLINEGDAITAAMRTYVACAEDRPLPECLAEFRRTLDATLPR
jgi:hypothetical protein